MMKPDKIITQNDVAKHAGVSRGLVSYVINDGPRKVASETRERVLASIQELGYRPNKHAQRLKQGGKPVQKSLGIVAGGQSFNVLERPYYNIILAGLFDEAHRLNHDIRFFCFFEALSDPVFFNKYIHREEISSLLMILPAMIDSNPENMEILDLIAKRINNVVCLEESIKGWPAVIFDRERAAQVAVEHLFNLGHQRIAFLAIEDGRLTGYRQVLMNHDIAYDANLVFPIDSSNAIISAYESTAQILQLTPKPTAIFCANDESAISAIASLRDHGIRVPQDMAITSIDNIGMAEMIRPSLTTVDVPKKQMVDYAMQILLLHEQIRDQQSASIVLPIELIVRESCGAKIASING